MSNDRDAEDIALVAAGDHARLLAKYEPAIIGRCVAALRGHLPASMRATSSSRYGSPLDSMVVAESARRLPIPLLLYPAARYKIRGVRWGMGEDTAAGVSSPASQFRPPHIPQRASWRNPGGVIPSASPDISSL